MHQSPKPTTATEAGNASTDSFTGNLDTGQMLRTLTALLGAYFNCSDCRQVQLLLNSTPEPSDTLSIVTRDHLAAHISMHELWAGTE